MDVPVARQCFTLGKQDRTKACPFRAIRGDAAARIQFDPRGSAFVMFAVPCHPLVHALALGLLDLGVVHATEIGGQFCTGVKLLSVASRLAPVMGAAALNFSPI